MITDLNRAYFDNMLGCGLQEGLFDDVPFNFMDSLNSPLL